MELQDLENIKTFIKSNNTKNLLVIFGLVVVIVLLLIWNINKTIGNKDKLDQMDKAYTALNDSIHIIKFKGDSTNTYIHKIAEVNNFNQLINSKYFNTLTEQQRDYIKELKETKGLLFGLQADISVIKNIVNVVTLDSNVVVSETPTTLTLKKNSKIVFGDSSSLFKYTNEIEVNNPMKSKMTYKYFPQIDIKIVRKNADGTYDAEIKSNDPNFEVKDVITLKLPEYKVNCNFWCKVKKDLKYIGAGVGVFVGGLLVGVILVP